MDQKFLRPLTETKYLATENAWRYRAIMRGFYINDQKFKHWMNKEDVFQELKENNLFLDYSLDMCKQDLDALTEWGNLNAVQDTTKVTTYQQFVNKQYRYQMTEYAIEIERMTIRLENLFIEGGSLEPSLLERIKEALQKLPSIVDEDNKAVGGWWSQMTNDFSRLNQNYQDYIRDWYSLKAEELMKTKNFLMYKEKLVDYLRNFIQELQHHTHEIELSMKHFDPDELEIIFEKITIYEMAIPRVDMGQITEALILENIKDKYKNIFSFFINTNLRDSEVENILSMTNEIIRKITRYAVNIMEMTSQYSSRKEEYKKVAKLFCATDTLEEAHKLSGQIFGISNYRHLAGELIRETENINSSIFDEKAIEMVLTPRVRTFREKIKKTAIISHGAEKIKMREKVLKERQEEEAILMSYLETGQVIFEHLVDLPEQVRRTLLKWLVRGIQERGGIAVTEHGKRYKLLNPGEIKRCKVSCEDGCFELPAYILEFEGD